MYRFLNGDINERKRKALGDQNVFLLSGKTLMRMCGDEGTVDGCHPNDLRFASIARVLGDFIQKKQLLRPV